MECPQIGMRVLVPLGKREAVGIVLQEHSGRVPDTIVLRDIICILDSRPMVTTEQLRLWRWVADYYMCPIGDVMAAALPSKSLDRQYGYTEVPKRKIKLPEYSDDVESPHSLDTQQQIALTTIYDCWRTKDTVLLHGVTSSGKTEVYIHLIQEMLAKGKQVLYLVPEIALTTQLTQRLQHVFGNQLYVYHSRVSDAQRMEIYKRIEVGNDAGCLIVGARSAVFLPVRNLGLVIVDEEHEPSYKQQDPAPRYHARSVAIMLVQQMGAKVLLGSATPSVETYYNAVAGKFGLATMPKRYAGLQLPCTTLIDLKRQYHRKEMMEHFSDPLVARINEELAKGKQIILFQNRRGYAPYIQCLHCGTPPKCTCCDVSLTVHMRTRQLVCHYCGQTIPLPQRCPECGGELKIHGFGTERLEEEVERLFPTAKVARMDLDTTRKKDAYQEIIDSFADHKVDILIGTQMVTKGLHFDDVSLVAVLNADHIVNQPDFRSYERAFHMLEQVSGRAGRTDSQGEVIIQTFDPSHPVYGYVQQHDYNALYDMQIEERRAFNYPPFCHLVVLIIRHRDLEKLNTSSVLLHQQLRHIFGERCSGILRPSVQRVQNVYSNHIRIKIEHNANFACARRLIKEQISYVENHSSCKGVQVLLDVDPV